MIKIVLNSIEHAGIALNAILRMIRDADDS